MADVVVIGGGPSGSVVAALLATWGHAVVLVTQAVDPARGLVNSLPPSTRKILTTVGILDIVERIGFPTTGNTVWWGDAERVEVFAGDGGAPGYQVFRPQLDSLLLDRASAAGVRVIRDAVVTQAEVGAGGARVSYRVSGVDHEVAGRIALDCSGRSGVVARQGWRRAADVQMQALLGVWSRRGGWPAADEAHTSVETYDDGWAWTVPTSASVRHTAVMIHGGRSRIVRGDTLAETYARELAKTRRLGPQSAGAVLEDVWACDASIYTASRFAGPGFLLVGDAGATIDPLSSFGLKKALTSAWLAAVAANTWLLHPEREATLTGFFSSWEAAVYATHLARSREFAVEAFARHPSPFWEAQARMPVAPERSVDERMLLRDPAVSAALAALKARDAIALVRNGTVRWTDTAIVRGHEIVTTEALPLDGGAAIRFLSDVDLVVLATLAPQYRQVADLVEAYTRRHPTANFVGVLGALAFLIARKVLHFE